ncbi:hypothetical protein NQ176_g2658 [Zarea fungicola]|uniref:Uncharacterized protein n=1 Tax=Zarea fungicola TaxID=93591 RepID=A0ACC1NNL4_9HYPO|nr:hypothetical protein NQ176_g2658 [Lecanicillium fungicola]
MQHQRILIIGAGFAGVWSALAAKRLINLSTGDGSSSATAIEVVVVAPEEELVIRPRLLEASPEKMTVPLGDIFRKTGIRFVKGTVGTIHTTQREVEVMLADGTSQSTIKYDRLILAAGSRLIRPEIPGFDQYAFNVDQMPDAIKLDSHLKKLASLPSSSARNTVVVCGGGFTGIEIAGDLPTRLRSIMGSAVNVRVILVDTGKEVASALGPGPRPVIAKGLKDLGVEVKLETAVRSIDSGGVTTSTGERIEALTTIWTAGMAATGLTEQVNGEKDKAGRLHVDPYLRVPSSPGVFATGDAAYAATDRHGNFSMMSCQHALYLGRVSGHNAVAELLNIDQVEYYQERYTSCLDLGPRGAVFTKGWERRVEYTGLMAKAIKKYICTVLIYPPANQSEALEAAKPITSEPAMTIMDILYVIRFLIPLSLGL